MAEWQQMFGDDDSDSESSSGGGSQQVDNTDAPAATFESDFSNSPFIIKKIPGIGGMRGVFAARNLPAGTLVLVEHPLYTWHGHFTDVEVLRSAVTGICSSEKAYAATQALHPFVLEDADQEEINTMQELWGETLALAVTDLAADGKSHLNAEELLRVSIALQHNAYGSGFYEMFSLVNHTCAPNCMKMCPTMDRGWRKASELWTTRDVLLGEELTICYNHIREMTDRSVSNFLYEHHRFQCTCSIHPQNSINKEGKEPLHGDDVLPDEDEWSSELQERVEYYEEQLETFTAKSADKMKHIEVLLDIITVCEEILSDIYTKIKESTERFATLAKLVSGLLNCSGSSLIENDFENINSATPLPVHERDGLYMMVRLHKVIVSAASVCIEELGRKEALLMQKQKIGQACRVVKKLLWAAEQYMRHAVDVASLQIYYLGSAHPDIAQTFLDIAEGISCALSLRSVATRYPSRKNPNGQEEVGISANEANVLSCLHSSNSERYSWALTAKSAQQMLNFSRKEGERVAALYKPHYALVQKRLVTQTLEMPNDYVD